MKAATVAKANELAQNEFKTYCIIGDPIHHSLSPGMQNSAFNALGLNATYIAVRVPSEDLGEYVASLRVINIAGFNVTIPHKVEVMKHLDRLDVSAKKANAANTVHNDKGKFIGYNTDIDGFIEPLHRRKVDLKGFTVLLLGAGGAARAVIAALSSENVAKVVIANRNRERAVELAKIGTGLGVKCETVSLDKAQDISLNSNLIVNTTPVGMNDEESVIDHEHIKRESIVYDIVYKPITTNLLEHAKYAGATVVYGYEMLIEQGAKSFEIWTGLQAPREVMKKNLLGIFGEPA